MYNENLLLGRELVSIALIDDEIIIETVDVGVFKLYDDGQSCCEARYITTDDTLEVENGSRLISINIKDAPNVETEDDLDVHEIQFLELVTTSWTYTFCTHVIHNGYYGGFDVKLERVE